MNESEKMRESAKIDYAVAGCGSATEAPETHGSAAIRLTFVSAKRRVLRLLDQAEREFRDSAVRPRAVAFSVTGPSPEDVQELCDALETAERRGHRAGVAGVREQIAREAMVARAQGEALAEEVRQLEAKKTARKKKARRS